MAETTNEPAAIRRAALEEAAAICDADVAIFDRLGAQAREQLGSDTSAGQQMLMADEQRHLAMKLARKIRALAAKPALPSPPSPG